MKDLKTPLEIIGVLDTVFDFRNRGSSRTMLSKLSETELELFRFIRDRRYIKGFIEPVPEIAMGKEIHP